MRTPLNASSLRISHRELARAQEDPRAWFQAHQESGPRRSYASITVDTIYRLHDGVDLPAARRYLTSRLNTAKLKNPGRRALALTNLESYSEWRTNAAPVIGARCRLLLKFGLGAGVVLGGIVSRIDIDLVTHRYRAVLLGARPDDWPDGFRFPLLQRAVAYELERDEEQVEVGVQEVNGDDLDVAGFSARGRNSAESAARELAQEVARLAGLAPP